MKAFMTALDSMGKDPLSVGEIPPTPGLVDLYFNDSTGQGEHGEKDMQGPWNQEPVLKLVESPALEQMKQR